MLFGESRLRTAWKEKKGLSRGGFADDALGTTSPRSQQSVDSVVCESKARQRRCICIPAVSGVLSPSWSQRGRAFQLRLNPSFQTWTNTPALFLRLSFSAQPVIVFRYNNFPLKIFFSYVTWDSFVVVDSRDLQWPFGAVSANQSRLLGPILGSQPAPLPLRL